MRFRNIMNNNSALVTVLAVVILICSLGFIIFQSRPYSYRPRIVDIYFFDLGTGTIFLGKSNQIAPIDAPSGAGPEGVQLGVRAYVFSCGSCDNEADRFIGWLERYTPEAKQQLLNPPKIDEASPAGPEMIDTWEKGHEIARYRKDLKTLKWVVNNSDAGYKIMQDVQNKCPNGQANPCFPQ
jgi:hypothetical protein